jgi:hypothetical protein
MNMWVCQTQVRVIVWSATDLPIGDPFEGMTDLYFKCKLGSNATMEQCTDTHLRLPAGHKGSFNWRMKFPLKLPVPEDCEGGTRLTLEVASSLISHPRYSGCKLARVPYCTGVGHGLHHRVTGPELVPDRPR